MVTMAAERDRELKSRSSAPLRRRGGGGAAAVIGIALALVLGMQLGGIPWRYRKQLWQLQGALAGAVVGFVVGRLSRSDPGPPEDPYS